MACPVIGVANYPRGNSLAETVLNDARDVRAPLTDLDTCGCPPANVTQLLDGEAIGSGSQGYQELQPKFLRALHQARHRKLPELSDLLAQNLPKVVR